MISVYVFGAPISHRNPVLFLSTLSFQPYSLMAGQGGDDLEDDYVPDDLIATSGDEGTYSHHGSSHGDLSVDEDASKPTGSAGHAEIKSNKRKRSRKGKQRKLKVSRLS
jgi:protein CMS1